MGLGARGQGLIPPRRGANSREEAVAARDLGVGDHLRVVGRGLLEAHDGVDACVEQGAIA